MKINSIKLRYPIILGILFMHLLILGLCVFFAYQFVFESFDSGVFILLAMFFGSLLICDIFLYRSQVHQRCWMNFSVNHDGLQWFLLKSNKYYLKWNEVRVFGVTGYDTGNPVAFVFFSGNEKESNSLEQKMQINNRRIVIEIRKETVELIRQYIPSDMYQVVKAIENKQDCFFRRGKTQPRTRGRFA